MKRILILERKALIYEKLRALLLPKKHCLMFKLWISISASLQSDLVYYYLFSPLPRTISYSKLHKTGVFFHFLNGLLFEVCAETFYFF